MGLGDKAAALGSVERAMAANPIEKGPLTSVLVARGDLARVVCAWESPERRHRRFKKLFRYRSRRTAYGLCRLTPARLGSIPISIRCG